MKLAQEVVFLINLHDKFERLCSPTTVESSFMMEVKSLTDTEVISKEAVTIIETIYRKKPAVQTKPVVVAPVRTVAPDPCGRGYSGRRLGGC